jgi:hypothetical protein
MFDFVFKLIKKYKRSKEANDRGWASLGRLMYSSKSWDDAKWERELRRSNRLYRLVSYGSAWKKK